MLSIQSVALIVDQFGVFNRIPLDPYAITSDYGEYIYMSKYLSAVIYFVIITAAFFVFIGKGVSGNDITIAVKLKWFLENTSTYLKYLNLFITC